jgi:HAD superfamily hydrolase (TIGR01509 family)
MIEGVIFDMDGVLIDSHPVHRLAWRKFLATLGKNVSEDQLDFILEGRRRDEILRFFLGEISEHAIAEYGRRKEDFFQQNFQDVKLVPGISAFLEELQHAGMKIGIATSASSYRTLLTLELLCLRTTFAAVVTADEVTEGKPNPEVYRLAAQRMSLRPEQLLVMEDAPSGVQAARSAGIRCIGITNDGRADALRRAGADCVIQDFVGLSIEKLMTLIA